MEIDNKKCNLNKEKVEEILKNKENIAFLPTPIHKLNNLSNLLNGANIYVKRDDMTGLALGGNKTRKIEYIIKDALDRKCDTIITMGAPQSNHCRQTAAACAIYRLKCYLILVGSQEELADTGNLLLDKMLGAEIELFSTIEEANERVKKLTDELKLENKCPYYVPSGGSFSPGVNGYISAYREILEDEKRLNLNFEYIFFASSSYGTHAGLLIGNQLFGDNKKKIYGISICKSFLDAEVMGESQILKLVADYNKTYDCNIKFSTEDIILDQRFNELGYAVISENDKKAIDLFAKSEAIILDPVYSGRAAAGMLKIIKNDEIPKNSNILFIHTGGAPALFTKLLK